MGWYLAQMVNPPAILNNLDGHAGPNMGRPRQRGSELCKACAPLGQHLEDVPVCANHYIKNTSDKLFWYIFVEQIRHRIHENTPGSFPPEWKFKSFRPQFEIKALFIRVPWNT